MTLITCGPDFKYHPKGIFLLLTGEAKKCCCMELGEMFCVLHIFCNPAILSWVIYLKYIL